MSLDAMSKTELKTYAETLGITLVARDSIDEIKAKIAEVTGEEFTSKPVPQVNSSLGGDLEKEITVIFNPDGNDNSRVVIGFDGSIVALPRSTPVKVKKKFLNVLSEAITTTYVEKIDQVTNLVELMPIDKPTYTYQIVSE